MRNITAVAGLALAFAISAPSFAAGSTQTVALVGTPATAGGTFTFADVAGPFTDTLNFTVPGGGSGTLMAILSSFSLTAATNIDFTVGGVTLNGVPLNVSNTGSVSLAQTLASVATVANNVLVINGTSGSTGSYSVTLSFAGAVPEPASWAMMISGLGMIGVAMRRRSRRSATAIA